jgi:hypothetical protein
MKKLKEFHIYLMGAAFLLIFSCAFTLIPSHASTPPVFNSSMKMVDASKSDATVEQKEGLYIFISCKPKSEYTYLGSVTKKIALEGKPAEMLNSLIKKVKKEYPSADAIIFTTIDMDKADAVKFK